jgi:hypothetical protein
VATFSTGITVTFNSVTAGEVTGLSWTWGGGLPKGRSVVWTDDAGTVSVQALGDVSTAPYGTTGTLTITGGGMDLTCNACCTSVGAAAELNGVTRYSTEFKIIQ